MQRKKKLKFIKKKAPCGEHECFSSFEKIEMYNQNRIYYNQEIFYVQREMKFLSQLCVSVSLRLCV